MKSLKTLADINKLINILLILGVIVIIIGFILIDVSVYLILLIAIVLFLVLLFILFKLNKFFEEIKKIAKLIEITDKLKDCNLDFEVDYEIDSTSKYSKATINLLIIKDTNKRLLNDIENAVTLMNKNDFTIRLNEDYYKGDYKEFIKFLNSSFDEREKTFNDIKKLK